MNPIGCNGDRVPVYPLAKARARVRLGANPITEAARLQRCWHYEERYTAHAFAGRHAKAKTPRMIEAELIINQQFGGSLLAYVDSLIDSHAPEH